MSKEITAEGLEEKFNKLIQQSNELVSSLHKVDGALATLDALFNELTDENIQDRDISDTNEVPKRGKNEKKEPAKETADESK